MSAAAASAAVVGLGENSLDHVCTVETFDGREEKQALSAYATCPGGQVATAMLGCARLGLSACYLGAVGRDPAGKLALEPLRDAGVDVGAVQEIAGVPTRTAVILVERKGGDRRVLGYRDPALRFAQDEAAAARIRSAGALLLDATDLEASIWAAGVARAAGVPVVLDVDQAVPGIDRLLDSVDFPVVSRGFAEEWGGSGSVRDGLRALAARGARMAVVTLGERGAAACRGGDVSESPAWPVEALDTTGAGDAFRAGFLYALLSGGDPLGWLTTANAVGALSCLGAGAQGGLPTRDALEALLATRR